MLAVLLLTLYPTLLCYYLFPKIGLNIRSSYLRASLAWFLGVYSTTFIIFLLAILYSIQDTQVLTKASFTLLVALEIFGTVPAFKMLKTFHLSTKNIWMNRRPFTAFNILVILSCFLFSFLFFNPQLAMKNNSIYTSPIYWDFHWHAAVIQNFVYGDNFPPQDESLSGVPMTYHFFGDLVFATYESLGLNLVTAINYGSILAFFFALLAIIGAAEEMFGSKKAGVVAVILAVLSGSGHFLYYFASIKNENIFEVIGTILNNSQQPWYVSFIPGAPYNYAGVVYNLFYYLEERHLIFGIPYLLLCLFIVYKRKEFSYKALFLYGALLGLFFYWEVYISIMVFCALLFILIFDRERKQTLILFLGFLVTFLICYLYLKHIVDNPLWFIPKQIQYPKIDFGFVTDIGVHSHSFSSYIADFIKDYAFAYGFRGIFFFISLFLIKKKNKKLFITLLAFVVPTFILINTIKLSPGVSENHKWIVPMNTFVDLIAAFSISQWFFERKRFFITSLGIICLFFLTISGFIELMPFLNSQPTMIYSQNDSDMIKAIRSQSPPTASFVGDERPIHLAGRKLFVGASAGPDYALNKTPRKAVISQLYASTSIQKFCTLANTNGIDFVEVNQSTSEDSLYKILHSLPYFMVDANNSTIFVNAQNGCPKYNKS